jgi:hypothetical protein
MGIRHRVKSTVLSEDVRRHYIGPLMKGGSCKTTDVARILKLDKEKVDRITNGAVTRTQPIKGSAAMVFDATFDRADVAHFDVIRAAHLIVDQLRNMRAEGARADYIVNAIETGRSLLALQSSSVSGPAAAVLDSLDAVLTFSSVLCDWGPKRPQQRLRDAKSHVVKAIETHRQFRREDDLYVSDFFLPTDYQNLMFIAAELDERTTRLDFDDERNPRTESYVILEQLEKWGAINELHEYGRETRSSRCAWNLATLFGLRANKPATEKAGDKAAAEEALLLCLQIQQPGPDEDLSVPEIKTGPRDIPYLREAYERALKRYRAEKEAEEEGGVEDRKTGKAVQALYAIITPLTGAAITVLLFVSELFAKPVPG